MKLTLRAALAFAASALLVVCPASAAERVAWIEGAAASAELVRETVFGGRVMLYEAGQRGLEPVVLVHGLSQNGAREWSKLIAALAGRHRVYALDLPGFGQSDKGNHLYSPANFAKVLEQVIPPRAGSPLTLIGHSLGGAVALAYAAAYPERVGRLVLVDVAGVLHRSVYSEFLGRGAAQRSIGVELPWFESVMRAIQLRAERLPLASDLVLEHAGLRQRVLRGDPAAIAAYALIDHDFNSTLRAIRVPTLVIWGADDTVAPLRTGQALASVIPHARLIVLEGAGHAPHLELPERFNAIVQDELDGRQMAALPYALPRAAIQGGRVGRCEARRSQDFSGDYDRIELDHCAEANISNARVGYLRAAHSAVRMANSHLRDGIGALDSHIEVNGGILGGHMMLDATTVDAAGVRFEALKGLATNKGAVPAMLRISVSEVSPPGNASHYLHEIIRMAPGEVLMRGAQLSQE